MKVASFGCMEGVDHTVSVTASTLYEAVALGLVALRGEEWIAGNRRRPERGARFALLIDAATPQADAA